jgi:hypothetical protein
MKKKFFMLPILYLYILLSLSSCHKDSAKPNTSASDYFPNAVGDYWEYEVHDSTSGYPSENYMVKVTIVGVKKLVDGKDAAIWKYEYPSHNDTNFIRITGDSVKVFDLIYSRTLRSLEFPRKIFILPFGDGQRWEGKLLAIDTFHVYAAAPVTTDAGLFTGALNIYHYYIAPNTEYIDNYWFQPNVGMVQISYNRYVLNPRNYQTWKLARYYLH